MRFFKNSKNRPTAIRTYSDPANLLGKNMECMMASGIGPWILTTLNNWRSEVTGYPSDRRRLPASSGSNDYELLGDRQTAVINYWSWGLCCPLEYAPGFSTWINCSCGPQIGMSKLAFSALLRKEERRRDFRGRRDLLLRWLILLLFQHGSCFSPASFNRLGFRAQLLPPFFPLFFPFIYLFFRGPAARICVFRCCFFVDHFLWRCRRREGYCKRSSRSLIDVFEMHFLPLLLLGASLM